MKQIILVLVMILGLASARWCHQDEPPVGNDPCEIPEGDIIIVTPPDEEDQRCHDILTLLSADDQSVDNTCDHETIEGQLIYNFHFYYRTPFVFDGLCLQHFVDFEGIEIPESHGFFLSTWEYTFDGVHIMFSIPHLDLESSGCNKITEDDQYIWQCTLGLHIWYQGFEQYDYQFIMTSTLSRYEIDTLVINIAKNVVIGDCCLNELNIETELSFCSDMTCGTYLPSPLNIVRKDIFYVEHRITTVEFQYYYLHNVQLKVGEFYPVVLAKNSSLQGKIRWQLQVNVAMNNMVVESIVQIHETAEARRQLASREDSEIGDNYMVKAESGKIIVLERAPEKSQKNASSSLQFAAALLLILTIVI